VVTAQVTRVLPFGALVEVSDGVPGLLVDDELRPPVGARVPMRITAIDRTKGRVAFGAT
jgi:ribosomal protein S1